MVLNCLGKFHFFFAVVFYFSFERASGVKLNQDQTQGVCIVSEQNKTDITARIKTENQRPWCFAQQDRMQ